MKKDYKKELKIVIIGGGTGLSVVLRGLKNITNEITAIVTVADDGGGSGMLREDLGMLPPGDIRSCILALANTEPVMEKLLQYRFNEGQLRGQSFGNLFLAAMNGICGNFECAIKEMSNVLAVTGKVLPMTTDDVALVAILNNDVEIIGESKIPIKSLEENSGIKKIYLEPERVKPLKESIDAIINSDLIILGPGSLYTSIIPNLLVEGIPEAIMESNGMKIYIPNIMTQPGETNEYNVIDHINAIEKHTQVGLIEEVIVNSEKIPELILKKYEFKGAEPVLLDNKQKNILKSKNIKWEELELIDISKDYIRHNAKALSKLIENKLKKFNNSGQI